MPGSILIVAIALELPADEIDALVRSLGASRYAVREAASLALEKLGPASLPALKRARDDADLEIRSRAGRLYETIEKAALVSPTRVRLDFAGVPLARALAEFSARSGQRVARPPDPDPAHADRPLTLSSPEPVAFWTAVDRICDAAGLQVAGSNSGTSGQPEVGLSLQIRFGRPRPPAHDSGPFRVRLMGLRYEHEIVYDDSPLAGGIAPVAAKNGAPAELEQFFLRLQVAAEPRLILSPDGPVRLSEARDDQGRSMLPLADPERPPVMSSVPLTASASSTLEVRTELVRPAGVPGVIKRLKGTIPVQVAARRSDPLVLSLTTPGAKARDEFAALRLIAVRPKTFGGRATIEVGLKLPARTLGDADAFSAREGVEPHHFEILDAGDKPVGWFLTGTSFDGDESKLAFVILAGARAGEPVSLRYYATTRTPTEIPFEFRDVRIP